MGFVAVGVKAQAQGLASTGEGDVHKSDAIIADDPYAGKEVKQRDLDGHALTQQGYGDDCTDAKCQRAKDRQLSEGTDWRDDVRTGKKIGGYGTETKAQEAPKAEPKAEPEAK